MSKIDDGGFVYPPTSALEAAQGYVGITRRDWLAGLAMAALLVSPGDLETNEDIAVASYEYADALIAEGRKDGE